MSICSTAAVSSPVQRIAPPCSAAVLAVWSHLLSGANNPITITNIRFSKCVFYLLNIVKCVTFC